MLIYIILPIVLTIVCVLFIIYIYKKNNKVDVLFNDRLQISGVPLIDLYQNDKKFIFLIDTGSDGCVINRKHLDSIITQPTKDNRVVYGIDGNLINVDIVQARFSLKTNTNFTDIIEKFQVFDISGFDNMEKDEGIVVVGILGTSFLDRYACLIDYNTHKLRTTKNKINKIIKKVKK